MNIEAYNLDSLRKLVRDLQAEKTCLRNGRKMETIIPSVPIAGIRSVLQITAVSCNAESVIFPASNR